MLYVLYLCELCALCGEKGFWFLKGISIASHNLPCSGGGSFHPKSQGAGIRGRNTAKIFRWQRAGRLGSLWNGDVAQKHQISKWRASAIAIAIWKEENAK